jgi:hypothetical protein
LLVGHRSRWREGGAMNTIQYRMIMMALLMIAAKLARLNDDPYAMLALTAWSVSYFIGAVIDDFWSEKKVRP